MTHEIYPCLWFDGNAKQAAEFYCSVFTNSRITSDTPMVVNFQLSGTTFMGLNGGPQFRFTPAISFFVKCNDVQEIAGIWNKLIDGGSALMPIDKYPWSDRYGWLRDKFGLTWQIMLDKQQSITPSFLFTQKQIGRAEEAIKFYTSVFDPASVNMVQHFPAEDANAGKVMYSEFALGKRAVIAMDGPGEHGFTFTEAVSFVVNCDTQEEIDYYWYKLTADGGEESMCGWLKDKFGVSWQVVPAILGRLMSDPERGQRVMRAFLQMKKFDLQKLLAA
jgi:predicted 3-demethylubiquinone-9 3-methyltransferase (glyoxalase superfamily)